MFPAYPADAEQLEEQVEVKATASEPDLQTETPDNSSLETAKLQQDDQTLSTSTTMTGSYSQGYFSNFRFVIRGWDLFSSEVSLPSSSDENWHMSWTL